jgi:hypothetical protein
MTDKTNSQFEHIATWRERIGLAADFPLHIPSNVEAAMRDEISELRAKLESSAGSAVSTAVGEPVLTKSAFEQIAESWDECSYDMIDDIGAALRRDFARLAAPTQAKPVDLSGLTRYYAIGVEGHVVKLADVERLFAAPTQVSAPQADPVQAPQKTFAERLYGSGPNIDQRRDALHTMALIFAAAETDSAREATFEDMFNEFCAVPRMSIFDGLTRHTGKEIATNYTFETEEFFEVEAVERLLAEQASAAHEVRAVPEELTRIGKLIVTQDNRYTDQPLFIVQQRRRVYGFDTDYCDNIVWVCSEDDWSEASKEEANEFEAAYQETCKVKSGWQRTGYMDEWEFVTACFTEQGCKDYLKRDGHNLKEPRIYADGSYRNEEYRTLRNWLMSLAAPASQPSLDEVTGAGKGEGDE